MTTHIEELAREAHDFIDRIFGMIGSARDGQARHEAQQALRSVGKDVDALAAFAESEGRRAEALTDSIEYLRNRWTAVCSRACPACVYEKGIFIRLCQVHEALATVEKRAEEAERRLVACTEAHQLAEATGEKRAKRIVELEREVERLRAALSCIASAEFSTVVVAADFARAALRKEG